MDIKSSLAAQQYAATRPATAPKPDAGAGGLGAFRQLPSHKPTNSDNVEDVAKAAMIGGADPHSLVTALAQSELAIETAVTVRDKVVEAYQEILRMPV